MRMKLKKWSVPFLVAHPEVYFSEDRYDSEAFIEFINRSNLYLEIGPGKGDFIVTLAKNNPEFNFLVIELNVSVAAMTAVKLVDNQLTNVKLIQDDALVVLPRLKPKSIASIFLNFSDPWPKKRHEKRRLTSKRFLDAYQQVLQAQAPLILKTDQQSLYEFTLDSLTQAQWTILSQTTDYQTLDPFDALTEYEQTFRERGQNIYRLIAIKE